MVVWIVTAWAEVKVPAIGVNVGASAAVGPASTLPLELLLLVDPLELLLLVDPLELLLELLLVDPLELLLELLLLLVELLLAAPPSSLPQAMPAVAPAMSRVTSAVARAGFVHRMAIGTP